MKKQLPITQEQAQKYSALQQHYFMASEQATAYCNMLVTHQLNRLKNGQISKDKSKINLSYSEIAQDILTMKNNPYTNINKVVGYEDLLQNMYLCLLENTDKWTPDENEKYLIEYDNSAVVQWRDTLNRAHTTNYQNFILGLTQRYLNSIKAQYDNKRYISIYEEDEKGNIFEVLFSETKNYILNSMDIKKDTIEMLPFWQCLNEQEQKYLEYRISIKEYNSKGEPHYYNNKDIEQLDILGTYKQIRTIQKHITEKWMLYNELPNRKQPKAPKHKLVKGFNTKKLAQQLKPIKRDLIYLGETHKQGISNRQLFEQWINEDISKKQVLTLTEKQKQHKHLLFLLDVEMQWIDNAALNIGQGRKPKAEKSKKHYETLEELHNRIFGITEQEERAKQFFMNRYKDCQQGQEIILSTAPKDAPKTEKLGHCNPVKSLKPCNIDIHESIVTKSKTEKDKEKKAYKQVGYKYCNGLFYKEDHSPNRPQYKYIQIEKSNPGKANYKAHPIKWNREYNRMLKCLDVELKGTGKC